MGEAAFDDPAVASQTGAMLGGAPSDDGLDAPSPQQPVLVVVIATVGQYDVGLLARPTDLAGHRPGMQFVQQRDELGDVVAVAAGQGNRKRNAGRVNQKMVL